MLLNEFFGSAIKAGNKLDDKDKDQTEDLFWYILDHDRLHKDYFMPLARKIKEQESKKRLNKEQCVNEFMPMVNKGCLEYYHKNNLKGKLGKLFPKELRKGLCEKLFDHYYEGITDGAYRVGS